MTTKPDQGARLVRALRDILRMEADKGFPNEAVRGGLDKFLANLQRGAGAHPTVRALADHGLLSVGYADLDRARRERWAAEAGRFLGDAAPPLPNPPPQTGEGRIGSPPQTAPSVIPAKAGTQNAPPPQTGEAGKGLDAPLSGLRSVNKTHAAAIRRMLVRRHMIAESVEPTVRDLLYLFPLRHIDRTERRTISQLRIGEEQTIEVVLWETYEVRLGRGGRIRATQATVGDATGNLRVIWWGNPWIAQQLKTAIARTAQTPSGTPALVLSGKVTLFQGKRQMESPEWELQGAAASPGLHTAGHVPVYPSPATTKGKRIPPRKMREIVRDALDSLKTGGDRLNVPDPLPDAARRAVGLLPLAGAVEKAHYPESEDTKEQARRRLAFDEFLAIQLRVGMERNYTAGQTGITLPASPEMVHSFIASLPFALTEGQRGAIAEAMRDVSSGGRPMSRLLQGDVGSGKTVVALAMLLAAVAGGYQGAMMAPTEVLADQHFLNVRRLLGGVAQPVQDQDWFAVYLEGRKEPSTVALLTGSTRARARREILRMAADGALDILIGTHALIQAQVALPNLALAVGDEQHRFGVLQRDALRGKSAIGEPHLLLMSATPIPRSLALTLYGGLDISTIRELPGGRQEIVTRNVELARAAGAEDYLVEQVRAGRQCFIVYPRIDDADDRSSGAYEDDEDAAGDANNEDSDIAPEPVTLPPLTAVAEYERLRSTTLSGVRVGLLHGRMPLAEKQGVMGAFRNGEVDVLVSTPVIEVGIDVPNATVMMIQSPTRFGLAQLHQLRGRVGRGSHRSYCFLVAESEGETMARLAEVRRRRSAIGEDAQETELWFRRALAQAESSRERLNVLARTNDGFEIAEADLRMRSEGDFFGTRQSGAAPIRMARLDDRDLLDASRGQAAMILEADPELRTLPGLRAAVDRLGTAVTDDMA